MRHQLKLKIREQLLDTLRAQLPSYMVPQIITVLEKMPVNENGKVDRRALAESIQTRAAPRGVVRHPTSDAERQMQRIWGKVLDIEAATIGLDDSFFQLGGNSITAMKVVGEARKLGIDIAVADVFRRDTLEDLARQPATARQVEAEIVQDILLDPATKSALLKEIDSLDLGIHSDAVADIFPLTSAQEQSVLDGIKNGQFANYFYIDLGLNIDLPRFKAACISLLERFPLFRASFPSLLGKFWQVIPHHLDVPLRIQDVEDGLVKASNDFCLQDLAECSPNEPPIDFTLLRHKTEGIRLVFRLSHAQYDGVCFPIILQALLDGYKKKEYSTGQSFTKYLSYAAHQRPKAMAYWKKVLQGATLNPIESKLLPRGTVPDAPPKRVLVEGFTPLPHLPGNITTATLTSAAWAMLVSHITGAQDIVYGHIVTGRNSALPGVEEIVGPLLNVMPVRVNLANIRTPTEMLLSLQEQFLDVGESDTMGFRDIMENCTDWPAGSTFDTVIQHQNVDEHLEVSFSEVATQTDFFVHPTIVPPSLCMISYPQGDRLQFKIIANTAIVSEKTAATMIDCLGRIMEQLALCSDVSLQSCIDGIDLGL